MQVSCGSQLWKHFSVIFDEMLLTWNLCAESTERLWLKWFTWMSRKLYERFEDFKQPRQPNCGFGKAFHRFIHVYFSIVIPHQGCSVNSERKPINQFQFNFIFWSAINWKIREKIQFQCCLWHEIWFWLFWLSFKLFGFFFKVLSKEYFGNFLG